MMNTVSAVLLTILASCTAAVNDYHSTTALNSSGATCPPWYSYDPPSGQCSFIHQLPQIVRQYGNSTELKMGFCMTVTNTSIVISQCPYTPVANFSHLYRNVYQVLPEELDEVNSTLCGPLNRRGLLCSECEEGHGLAAYRYFGLMCVKCSHSALNMLAYVVLLFVAPTIFFFFFVLFKIDVHSGHLTGFIFFSHIVSTTTFFFPNLAILPQSLFGYWPIHILFSLYGVWSLNSLQLLIPPFCVSPHLTTLQLISLGYIPSVYPLVLCIVTYYLIEIHDRGNRCLVKTWTPFQKLLKKMNFKRRDKTSIIHTFGTLILLSYGNNLFVSFSLTQSYALVSLDQNTYTMRKLSSLAVDLKTPFFSLGHVPYFVLGVVGGLLTVLLPLVLVLIFPTRVFPKLVHCCGLRRWHGVRTFMEVFTGTYKDGTQTPGDRDYRFVAWLYLLARIVIGLCWMKHGPNISVVQSYSWLITSVPFIIGAVWVAFFKPHRRILHNGLDVVFLLLSAKLCLVFHFVFETSITESNLKVLVFVFLIDLAIPQAIVVTYLIYKLLCLASLKRLCFSLIGNRSGHEEQEVNPLIH